MTGSQVRVSCLRHQKNRALRPRQVGILGVGVSPRVRGLRGAVRCPLPSRAINGPTRGTSDPRRSRLASRNQARRLSADRAARGQAREAVHPARLRLVHRYPRIVEAVHKLRTPSFVIDGEPVILGGNGVADFDALHNRQRDDEVRQIAFDLLAFDGVERCSNTPASSAFRASCRSTGIGRCSHWIKV